jgi:DNA-binding response OmpR family regulator
MRILLAENDTPVARFHRKGLEEEQFRVDLAEDGEKGLVLALVDQYDLLILDLLLPKRDGMSVLTELRRRHIDTPVLLLTARDAIEDRIAGLNAGGDDCLSRPFAFAELLARARALLRRRMDERSVLRHVGDLVLDPLSHRVTRAGRSIELTSREFSLLECFLEHPNEVLTRSILADQVWGHDLDNFSNVVDVYVHYLRNKIDRAFETTLIHTVRGQGYVLETPEFW